MGRPQVAVIALVVMVAGCAGSDAPEDGTSTAAHTTNLPPSASISATTGPVSPTEAQALILAVEASMARASTSHVAFEEADLSFDVMQEPGTSLSPRFSGTLTTGETILKSGPRGYQRNAGRWEPLEFDSPQAKEVNQLDVFLSPLAVLQDCTTSLAVTEVSDAAVGYACALEGVRWTISLDARSLPQVVTVESRGSVVTMTYTEWGTSSQLPTPPAD